MSVYIRGALLSFFVWMITGYWSVKISPYSNPYLRVALEVLSTKEKIVLLSESGLLVWGAEDRGKKNNLTIDLVKGNKLRIDRYRVDSETIFIYSKSPIIYRRRSYPGIFQISVVKGGIILINLVRTENYLKGVIRAEVISSWPLEALKTQAIISRSYALNKMLRNRNLQWDLVADQRDQVYRGVPKEIENINKAVQMTYGQVVIYRNQVISTFFHSNSGGYTEDSGNVWQKSLPYLSVKKTNYGTSDPSYNWEHNVPASTLARALKKAGYPIDSLSAVQISAKNSSGRVQRIKFFGDKNEEMEILATRLRSILGGKNIKSLMFDIITEGNIVTFQGRGFGHGVGVCQWCAKEMAEEGMKAEQIIEYFYNGIDLITFPQ